jgi:hypothetical protein
MGRLRRVSSPAVALGQRAQVKVPGQRTRKARLDALLRLPKSGAGQLDGGERRRVRPQPGWKVPRARCVPDQAVIRGILRSPTDNPAISLTCAHAAHHTAGHVLLSRRSRGAQDDHRRREHAYGCAPELILPDVTYCSHQLHGDFTVQFDGSKGECFAASGGEHGACAYRLQRARPSDQ